MREPEDIRPIDVLEPVAGKWGSLFDEQPEICATVSIAISLKRIADALEKPKHVGISDLWDTEPAYNRLVETGTVKPRAPSKFICPSPVRDEHVTAYIQRIATAFEHWANAQFIAQEGDGREQQG